MPNAKDLQGGKDDNILIVGDSGTGKTRFFASIVAAGGKPYVYDYDNGMKSVRGIDIEYFTCYDAARGIPANSKIGRYEYGTGWEEFQKDLNRIGAMIDRGTCPYTCLGFDSLTTLADLCMNFVLKQKNRFETTQQDWGSFLNLMKAFASQITSWPIQCVLTAHIKRDENLTTGVTEKLPLISGQFSGMVPIYFDEVYFTNVEIIAGVPTYKIITRPSPTIKMAKSRLGVPSGIPLDYAEIMKAIRAA